MKILHLEDNLDDATLVREVLHEEWPHCDVLVVDNREDFTRQVQQGGHDLILSDFTLMAFNGLEALKLARRSTPETPFIFLSGTIGEDRAIEAVHAGAQDYVLKDNMRRLVTAIRRALGESEERRQRQSAEEALRRFAAILESTPDFVGMAALDGRVFYVNRAGLRMTGHKESQDPGLLSMGDFHPPAIADRIRQEYIPIALHEGSWVGETALISGDGGEIPVSQVIIAHKDAGGGVEYLSTVMRDLSAFKEAERHIREQADLINKARDAIIVSDLNGRITFWNHGAGRVFGWTPLEAIGRLGVELLGEAALADSEEAGKALVEDGEWRGELQLRNKDGELLVIENRVTMIRDAEGRPTSRLSIATDITERKKIEEQFLRAQRLEGIGMLAAGIAHDLNNVLAPILMIAPVLRERATNPADTRMLTNLEKSAERGAGLVRQILGFAQGISGQPQITQVKHIMRDLSAVIRQTFPKNIQFQESAAVDLWAVKANPTQIHQVLLNLCVNARDAMPKGGRLDLTAENTVFDELGASAVEDARPGAYVVLQVEDTGSGIPPDIRKRIWNPFFTTKEASKGTGLGLSTVLGIVKEHHGFVSLKTEVGRGSTFQVYLPAVEVGREDLAEPLPNEVPRGNGELILVVDDDASVREVTTVILAHHGYRVLGAGDGAEAVALLAPRSAEVSLVITDLQMPHLDGAALASVVLRLNPAMPILAISGMGSGRSAASSKRFAGDFLLKPFKAGELLATVDRMIKQRTPV